MDETTEMRAERYEYAIRRLEKHIRLSPSDGTLSLDVSNGRDVGIEDPVIFADLKRSLDETNKKIRNGELRIEEASKGLSLSR